MEMLLVLEEPTNSTRSWYTATLGSTPSIGITASQSYKEKQSFEYNFLTLPSCTNDEDEQDQGSIFGPVEVEVLDADAGGVGAGQKHRGAVHGFHGGDFSCGDLQSSNTPDTWQNMDTCGH